MSGDVIKSFLVGLGFDVDDSSLAKFNKAIAGATVKVTALYATIQTAATGIFFGIAKISEGFEEVGYSLRLVAPAVNKMLLLREAMLSAYRAAGIDLTKVVKQSILFNFSLQKTKYALEAVYKSVAARFFPLLTKQLDIFRLKIFANMPKIQAALERFVNFIFKAFEATVELGTRVWSILGRVYDFFVKLDNATDGWSTVILAVIAAWKLLNLSFLASPIGILLSLGAAILALYDDYQVWKEGGKSLINWGSDFGKVLLDLVPILETIAGGFVAIKVAVAAWNVVAAVAAPLSEALGVALSLLRGAVWALNAAWAASPIGVIVAGLAALGFAAYEVWKHWDFLKEKLTGFFSWAEDKFTSFSNWISNLFSKFDVVGKIKGAFADVGGAVGDLVTRAPGAIQSLSNGSASALNSALQPQPLINQNGGSRSAVLNQQTNINIQGSPDAQGTGRLVAGEQTNVNRDATANLGSKVR